MKKALLMVLILLLIPATTLAKEITLTKETKLRPQGWVSGEISFRDGTAVTLNENG